MALEKVTLLQVIARIPRQPSEDAAVMFIAKMIIPKAGQNNEVQTFVRLVLSIGEPHLTCLVVTMKYIKYQSMKYTHGYMLLPATRNTKNIGHVSSISVAILEYSISYV